MAYVRKTKDEYQVQGNYGYGYEEVYSSDDKQDAKQRLKEYRDNEKGVSFKLVTKRVKIED
jgi:hypothetical protein